MKKYLFLIFMLYSILGFSQYFRVYQNGNLYKSYRGKISNLDINMFFQIANDSTINGYYYYERYKEKIPISGYYKKDSIILYEFDKKSNKTAAFIGEEFKMKFDSTSKKWSKTLGFTGYWTSMQNSKNFKFELYEQSIIEGNDNEFSLILRDSSINYTIPISKYLDDRYSLSYDNTCKMFLDSNLYSVFIFTYKPLLKDELTNQYGKILLYVKLNKKGFVDTIQTVDLDSPIKKVFSTNYKNIFSSKDTMSLDIYNLKDDLKISLTMNKKHLNDGILFAYDKIINFPKYLYDTLTLELENEYNLILKYRCIDFNKNYYYYNVDSVFEKNKKNLSELSNFCEDLKVYTAFSENSETYFGDYKTISYNDYNFDGYNDIYIFNHEESGANNRAQTIWLYNSKIKKYEKDSFLSSLSIWGIDEKNKTILSGWRMSVCDYETVTYQLIEGKFIKVASESQSCNSDKTTVTKITRRLINNKWVEEKKTE